MRPKAVMACIHPYSSRYQVGSQHIARQFVKNGYDVAYISAPLSPFHILKYPDKELLKRFRIYRRGGAYHLKERLWQYVPLSLFTPVKKPLLQSEFVLRNWKFACVPNVFKKLSIKGFLKSDVFYFDNILAFPILKGIDHKISILRIMDNHAGFPGYPNVAKSIEADIRKSVDLVIHSADTLREYAQRFAGKQEVVHIPNGVAFNSFVAGTKKVPSTIRHLRKPIAVYVGAIEAWFDNALLTFATRKLPHISFLIIGPNEKADPKLKKVPNVHMIGPVDHKVLQSYLYNCNVGIIPFNVKKYPDLMHGVNPIKLYEYMACGLPVVSVGWEELRRIKSPAVLCDTKESFVEQISIAVKRIQDRDTFVDFARQNSWDESFKKLLCRIQ